MVVYGGNISVKCKLFLSACVHFRYVAWICRAEDLVLAEERTSEADKIKIMEARERQKEKIKKLMGTKKSTESVDTASDDGKHFLHSPSDERMQQ